MRKANKCESASASDGGIEAFRRALAAARARDEFVEIVTESSRMASEPYWVGVPLHVTRSQFLLALADLGGSASGLLAGRLSGIRAVRTGTGMTAACRAMATDAALRRHFAGLASVANHTIPEALKFSLRHGIAVRVEPELVFGIVRRLTPKWVTIEQLDEEECAVNGVVVLRRRAITAVRCLSDWENLRQVPVLLANDTGTSTHE